MGQIVTLLRESSEWAFLLGTFLYGMAFAGDLAFSKLFASGEAASPGKVRSS